jgi:hypothetical protein
MIFCNLRGVESISNLGRQAAEDVFCFMLIEGLLLHEQKSANGSCPEVIECIAYSETYFFN